MLIIFQLSKLRVVVRSAGKIPIDRHVKRRNNRLHDEDYERLSNLLPRIIKYFHLQIPQTFHPIHAYNNNIVPGS